jgi:diguanylate cyclase (GGDEF)-like protein/PAS domain S-box-containing protein
VTTADFEELYEHAPCGYFSTTPDGRFLRMNETFLAWSGYSRADLVGKRFPDLLDVGSRLFYETRYLPVLRLSGEAREIALTIRRSDGALLPVLVNSLLLPPGAPAEIRTAVFDATGRQDYERELLAARRNAEASELRVRVLQDASSAFSRAESEHELANELAASARHALDASQAAVLLLDENGALRPAGGDDPFAELRSELLRFPANDAVDSRGPILLSDLSQIQATYPALVGAMRDAHVEAICATPLLDQSGMALGAISCYFGRHRQFDPQNVELQAALARQAAEVLGRVRLEERLRRMALHDQLTGLANRQLLAERLGQALSSAERARTPIALIFLDVDGFKAVNDGLGHAVGDAVLREIADRLRTVVRGGDTIGRFGGDEFVVVCENADELAAHGIAQRISAAIRDPLPGVPSRFAVTASIGIAVHQPSGTEVTPEGLLITADAAMYLSKDSGKDRITAVAI